MPKENNNQPEKIEEWEGKFREVFMTHLGERGYDFETAMPQLYYFIRTILQSQRAEILEEVEEIKKEIPKRNVEVCSRPDKWDKACWVESGKNEGFNSCLYQIQEKLKGLKTK